MVVRSDRYLIARTNNIVYRNIERNVP